jgi:hypothetical protein
VWGGARGSGDRGLARWCSDGEGLRVAARGDQRGGGWQRKGIRGVASCSAHVGLAGDRAREEKHEECRLKWPTLLVPSQPTGIKSVGLVHMPTLLS